MNITTNQISNIQQYKKPTNNKFDGAGKQPQKSSNFLTFKGNPLQIAQEGVQQANKFIRKTIDKTSRKIVKKSMSNNWSDDIFTVHEVDDKQSPVMYKLIDKNNKILKRKYYHFELIEA